MVFLVSRTVLLTLAAGAAMGSTAALAECRPGPFPVSLSAQPLDERLRALRELTGCATDADPALIGGRTAPALRGEMRTDEAFFASLAGTGLEAGPTQGRWRVSRDAQDGFAEEVESLRARMEAAVKAGRISPADAARIGGELDAVASGVPALVREKGFLSAGESASYRRTLEEAGRALGS